MADKTRKADNTAAQARFDRIEREAWAGKRKLLDDAELDDWDDFGPTREEYKELFGEPPEKEALFPNKLKLSQRIEQIRNEVFAESPIDHGKLEEEMGTLDAPRLNARDDDDADDMDDDADDEGFDDGDDDDEPIQQQQQPLQPDDGPTDELEKKVWQSWQSVYGTQATFSQVKAAAQKLVEKGRQYEPGNAGIGAFFLDLSQELGIQPVTQQRTEPVRERQTQTQRRAARPAREVDDGDDGRTVGISGGESVGSSGRGGGRQVVRENPNEFVDDLKSWQYKHGLY